MKIKHMLRLLSLGTNLYLISQDKELMDKLTKLARAGKEKYDEFFHSDEDDEEEEDLLAHLAQAAGEIKERMNREMEAIARKTYDALHIAHADEIEKLRNEIEQLRTQITRLQNN